MHDCLIVTAHASLSFELSELAKSHGYRVKGCVSVEQALQWLDMRSFDVICFGDDTTPQHLQEASSLLWKKNPNAVSFVVDFNRKQETQEQELRLLGVQLLSTLEDVSRALKTYASHNPISQDGFNILVVEDLESPRDIICIFIESLGFSRVVGVRSAHEALKLLESGEEEFSCVVTDIKMPEISGKELIEVIRKNKNLQHLPIIVLTAYGTVDTLIDCLKAGASGFLVKPPKKNDMLRELSRAIRIASGQESPRLASHEEAEYVRQMIESRKVI